MNSRTRTVTLATASALLLLTAPPGRAEVPEPALDMSYIIPYNGGTQGWNGNSGRVQQVSCRVANWLAPYTSCPPVTGYDYTPLAGLDVAPTFDGQAVFVIGSSGTISKAAGGVTVQLPGGGTRIAVAPNNHPWVVNGSGQIWRDIATSDGQTTWEQVQGWASDIAIGAGGQVWVLGTGGVPYKWDNATSTWTAATVKGERIAVDPSGNPWIVAAGTILSTSDGNDPTAQPALPQGAAADVTIGADGSVYALGDDHCVWKQSAGSWLRVIPAPPPNTSCPNASGIGAGKFFYLVGQYGGYKPVGAP